jgi:glyceraldehyde 3-phosphate dehydrogenase
LSCQGKKKREYQMAARIGINGFGRIGRLTLRSINERHKGSLEVVAINSHADIKTDAHLLKWDSTYGRYPGKVEATADSIIVDDKEVWVLTEHDPAKIRWWEYGVEIVIESTGAFTDARKAAAHLQGGVKKVVISAGAANGDITLVLGVNEDKYLPAKHNIISSASCTTNCIAPVVKILHENFGVVKGLLTTVHSYTNDQRLLDGRHRDLRRARTPGISMIPTTTGAAKMVGVIIPELNGKIDGLSIRVPTTTVSVVDFVAELSKQVTKEQVNQAFQAAAWRMPKIIEYCEEELVSVDFKGNPASSIIDAPSTMVADSNMVKVIAWYDNEWGYSCRLGDLVAYVAERGLQLPSAYVTLAIPAEIY